MTEALTMPSQHISFDKDGIRDTRIPGLELGVTEAMSCCRDRSQSPKSDNNVPPEWRECEFGHGRLSSRTCTHDIPPAF